MSNAVFIHGKLYRRCLDGTAFYGKMQIIGLTFPEYGKVYRCMLGSFNVGYYLG